MYYWHQNNYYQPTNQGVEPMIQQPYYQDPYGQQPNNLYPNQLQYMPYPEQYMYPANQTSEGDPYIYPSVPAETDPYNNLQNDNYLNENLDQVKIGDTNEVITNPESQQKKGGTTKERKQHLYTNMNQQLNQIGLLEQLTKQITFLNDKIEKMEKENEELKEQVENIKPINIGNINYKIQELTVDELSGNLMIGMTALGEVEDLQKLINEQGNIKFNDIDTENVEEQMVEQELEKNGLG